MKRKIIGTLITLSVLSFGVFIFQPCVSPAQGAGILPEESGSGNCADNENCGNYSVDDFLSLAVNVSNWILGIVGSAALLFFVYGGFLFILSGGSSDKVDQGKRMIIGSVVGLVIVFSSYLIIQFVMSSLGFTKAEGGSWSKWKPTEKQTSPTPDATNTLP